MEKWRLLKHIFSKFKVQKLKMMSLNECLLVPGSLLCTLVGPQEAFPGSCSCLRELNRSPRGECSAASRFTRQCRPALCPESTGHCELPSLNTNSGQIEPSDYARVFVRLHARVFVRLQVPLTSWSFWCFPGETVAVRDFISPWKLLFPICSCIKELHVFAVLYLPHLAHGIAPIQSKFHTN